MSGLGHDGLYWIDSGIGRFYAGAFPPRIYHWAGIRPITFVSLGLAVLGIAALSRVKINPQEG